MLINIKKENTMSKQESKMVMCEYYTVNSDGTLVTQYGEVDESELTYDKEYDLPLHKNAAQLLGKGK
jgi:hypothetical protein